MSSYGREIASNTSGITIGRNPRRTLHPQDLATKTKRPRSRSSASKIYKLLNSSFLPEPPSTKVGCSTDGDDEEEEEEQRKHVGTAPDAYFNSFPPGYRFRPFDLELVIHYLKRKVMKEPLPSNRINEVDIYQYNPEQLAERYKRHGEDEMYFFTPRNKKYPNGNRPNRAAANGYWRASGIDKSIMFQKQKVGFKKTLVYYNGKFSQGEKTNWIMHEFRVNHPPPRIKTGSNDMRLDDWVLCRIYKKINKYDVVVDSKGHTMNQMISQIGIQAPHFSSISPLQSMANIQTTHFSNIPLHSMANNNELSDPNFGITMEMLEPSQLSTSAGSTGYPTKDLPWSSMSMEFQDENIWSSFMSQENFNFDPELDFFNGIPNDSSVISPNYID